MTTSEIKNVFCSIQCWSSSTLKILKYSLIKKLWLISNTYDNISKVNVSKVVFLSLAINVSLFINRVMLNQGKSLNPF